jgi:hypothetical protein
MLYFFLEYHRKSNEKWSRSHKSAAMADESHEKHHRGEHIDNITPI